MKRFKHSALMATLIGIMVVASGCGSKSSNPAPGAPGAPGYYGGTVTPLPGGAVAIAFSGSNVYNSGQRITGGQVTGSGQCYTQGCYCGYFSASGNVCWQFANPYTQGTGSIAVGGNSMPVGQPGTIQAVSKYEPNSGLTLVVTPGSDALHSNVSGLITLSPQYMQMNFPGGLPGIVGVAFDIVYSGGQGFGGVLFYTSTGTPPHGGFLRI